MILISTQTNSGALNKMVPSELTRGITMGELLIFLGCWKQGPYIVPDQQGDNICDVAGGGLFLQWLLANTLIVSIRNVHVSKNQYGQFSAEKLSKPLIPLYTKIYRKAIQLKNTQTKMYQGKIDKKLWLNYCRKSYVLPKPRRCTYVWGLGKILWSNTSGYIVGTYIIHD